MLIINVIVGAALWRWERFQICSFFWYTLYKNVIAQQTIFLDRLIIKFSFHVRLTSRECFCSLSSNKLTFVSKNKQIFVIYNFKKALMRVRLIQKVISSCFAAYSILFLARKSNNLIFSSTCTCYVSAFRQWYVRKFLFRWQLRYFLDKISLVFAVFFHFFSRFFVLSRCLFKVLSSRSIKFILSENSYECFLNFIVLLCPFPPFFQPVFPPLLSRCFFLLYDNLCIKTTLNLVTLVTQEIGGKTKKTVCIMVHVIMHAQ